MWGGADTDGVWSLRWLGTEEEAVAARTEEVLRDLIRRDLSSNGAQQANEQRGKVWTRAVPDDEEQAVVGATRKLGGQTSRRADARAVERRARSERSERAAAARDALEMERAVRVAAPVRGLDGARDGPLERRPARRARDRVQDRARAAVGAPDGRRARARAAPRRRGAQIRDART